MEAVKSARLDCGVCERCSKKYRKTFARVLYLLDVTGKPLVEVLHVLLLLLPRTLDRRDAGLRHHGVRPGRRADVAVAGSLAAAHRRPRTRVRRAIDNQMPWGHHRLVDRCRRLRLVRRASFVGCRFHARSRTFGRAFARDAYLSHVEQMIPPVMQPERERLID